MIEEYESKDLSEDTYRKRKSRTDDSEDILSSKTFLVNPNAKEGELKFNRIITNPNTSLIVREEDYFIKREKLREKHDWISELAEERKKNINLEKLKKLSEDKREHDMLLGNQIRNKLLEQAAIREEQERKGIKHPLLIKEKEEESDNDESSSYDSTDYSDFSEDYEEEEREVKSGLVENIDQDDDFETSIDEKNRKAGENYYGKTTDDYEFVRNEIRVSNIKEIKTQFYTYSELIENNGSRKYNFIDIPEGDFSYDRVGKNIKIVDIEIRITSNIIDADSSEDVRCRIMLVRDRNSNKQNFSVAELFDPNNYGVNTAISENSLFRYDILYDDVYTHNYIGITEEYKTVKNSTNYKINGKFELDNIDLNIFQNGEGTYEYTTPIGTGAYTISTDGSIQSNIGNKAHITASDLIIDTPVISLDQTSRRYKHKGLTYYDKWDIYEDINFGEGNLGTYENIVKGNMAIVIITQMGTSITSTTKLDFSIKLKINYLN